MMEENDFKTEVKATITVTRGRMVMKREVILCGDGLEDIIRINKEDMKRIMTVAGNQIYQWILKKQEKELRDGHQGYYNDIINLGSDYIDIYNTSWRLGCYNKWLCRSQFKCNHTYIKY